MANCKGVNTMSYWGNNCDYNCPECPFSHECVLELQSENQGQQSFDMQCIDTKQMKGYYDEYQIIF